MSDLPNQTANDKAYLARLERAIDEIWGIARSFGLDPYPVNFELVPATIMYEFGAYGLPGRFSHWSRGKAYYRMKTEYDYGLSKIYELVVNTNPSYAFLMEQNDVLQNMVVVAHVLGHTDFFKNNVYFHATPPNMIDKVSVSADRIRKYEYDHGEEEVERFLDAVLAIEEHIDPHVTLKSQTGTEHQTNEPTEASHRTSEYDDLWSLSEREKRRKQQDEERERASRKHHRFPAEPEEDLLWFLAEHAPTLQPWQRDILLIVREEMLYFVPQMRTKVSNEGWACLVGSSLIQTDQGLLRYDALHDRLANGETIHAINGKGGLDPITDRHIRRDAPTIRLRTKRGFILEGAEEHKLNIGSDQWIALRDVQLGQRIPLSVGANTWAEKLVAAPQMIRTSSVAITEVARVAGVGVHTVYRSLGGKTTYAQAAVAQAIASTGFQFGRAGKPQHGRRHEMALPEWVDERLGAFLGYLIGDGNIHTGKSGVGFTSGDREAIDHYASLVCDLFGITPKVFWDERTVSGKGGRWRAVFYSADALEFMTALGIDIYAKARQKRIPDVILRSPKVVASAFLRAYFDCDGCASLAGGAILSTFSNDIAQSLQTLLLNYGILSRRHGVNVSITGKSAEVFTREIGFGLARKQERMQEYLDKRQWFLKEKPWDAVVSVERDIADVYDITVADSHQYVANGMVHHNSYWHSKITREMDLTDAEFTAFAQMHAGVLATSRMRLNPYHLGYNILRDIERRWDNPTDEEREKFGRQPGQGMAQLFSVRETESDASLIRNYLTKELVEELDLYLYRKVDDEWVIVEKDWEKVRDGIAASMTNHGIPHIVVWDSDYNGNTELMLRHYAEDGQELDLLYAERTLEHMYRIWSRPVHIETVREGEPLILSYNGVGHSRSAPDESDA
jgi:stage V sporulation protein R